MNEKEAREFYEKLLSNFEHVRMVSKNGSDFEVTASGRKFESIEEKKMDLVIATELKKELIEKGFDTVIFDPQLSPHTDEIRVIVRGKDESFVREKEKFQCYRCLNFKEKMTGKHFTEFCKAGLTVPIEGVNCPMFKPRSSKEDDFLEKHVDLVIRKTLVVTARDLLIKACKGTDDPLYKVYRKLETDFIEHLNAHKI